MAKKVYSEGVKKWAIGGGITATTLIGLIFVYLASIGAITVNGYSGDVVCAGTLEDPCYAYINFTANEDIFIYPIAYDPWGRNTPFEFDPSIKSWKLQRSWGSGWRDLPLDKSCTGTWCGLSNSKDERLFSVAFREGRDYQIRIVAYKNNPDDTIKWAAFDGKIDPYWLPVASLDERRNLIAENPIEWIINKTGDEQNLNVTYNILNDTTTEFCVSFEKPQDKTNYTSLLDLKGRGLSDIPITKNARATEFEILVPTIDGRNIDVNPGCFLVTYNKSISNLSFKIGWESVLIDGSASTDATSLGTNDNFCIDANGYFHVTYQDGGSDLWYANSSTGGTTWSAKELLTGTVEQVEIFCDASGVGEIVIGYLQSADLFTFTSSDNGGTFTGPTIVEDDVGSGFFDSWAGALTNDGFIEYCGVDTSGDLIHGDMDTLDTGAVINDSDTDHCDIEVGPDNNTYIVATDTTTDDLTILSDIDVWGTRTSVYSGSAISTNLYDGVSLAISDSGKMGVALINNFDLIFCNSTVSNWNGTWTCGSIDASTSHSPNIGITEDDSVYIFYGDGTTSDGVLYRANSTNWTIFDARQTIQSSALYPSIAQSSYPLSNRINETLHYIYTDSSDVYYENISVPYQPTPCTIIESPGTYTLQNNITNSPGTCFTIASDDVILDGNGFIIDGEDTGYGVYANGRDNITIQNFEGITQFNDGIRLEGGTTNYSIIKNKIYDILNFGVKPFQDNVGWILHNNFSYTNVAIDLDETNNTLVYNNTASFSNVGMGMDATSYCNIENNTFRDNRRNIFSQVNDVLNLRNTYRNNILINGTVRSFDDDSADGDFINFFVYNNSFGQINWTDDSVGGFLDNMTLLGDIGLGRNVTIESNLIYVNTTAFSLGAINSTANLTLYGMGSMSFHNPEIQINGETCDDCIASSQFTNDTIAFSVPYVGTTYSIGEQEVSSCSDGYCLFNTTSTKLNAYRGDNENGNSDCETASGAINWMSNTVGVTFDIGTNDPIPTCLGLTEINTTGYDLLTSSDNQWLPFTVDDAPDNGGGFVFELEMQEVPITNISTLIWNYEGKTDDLSDLWLKSAVYNNSANDWIVCASRTGTTTDSSRSCVIDNPQSIFDENNKTHFGVFGDWDVDTGASDEIYIDQVTVNVYYNQYAYCDGTTCYFLYPDLLEDISATDEALNYQVESAMKWNLSLLDDFTIPTIDDVGTKLCLYLESVGGSPDNDVRAYYIDNQTWTEGINTTGFDAFSNLNATTEVLNSTSTNTFACFNVSTQIQRMIDDSNNLFSMGFYDPDETPDSSSATITNLQTLNMGDFAFLAETFYRFSSSEDDVVERRPFLIVNLTEGTPETPPVVQFVSPTDNNQVITNERNWSYVNITCDKNCDADLDWNGVNESMTGSGSKNAYINKTGLAYGNYTFIVFVNNSLDDTQQNNTEMRWVFLNYTSPNVTFVSPTPINTTNGDSDLTINITCDINCHGVILDWNGTNESMTRITSKIWKTDKTGLGTGVYTYQVYANNTLSVGFMGISDRNWVNVSYPEVPGVVAVKPTSGTVNQTFVKLNCEVTPVNSDFANASLFTNASGSWARVQTDTRDKTEYETKGYKLFQDGLADGTYLFGCEGCTANGECNYSSNYTATIAWTEPEESNISGYYLFRTVDRDEDDNQFCRQFNTQGSVGTGNGHDVGCLWKDPHTGTQSFNEDTSTLDEDIYCNAWLQFFFDEPGNFTTGQELDRMYCHVWGTDLVGKLNGTYTTVLGLNYWGTMFPFDENYTDYYNDYFVHYDARYDGVVGESAKYELVVIDWNDLNHTVLGEDIWNLSLAYNIRYDLAYPSSLLNGFPQIASNANQKSFCILNPGNNTELQGLDTDSDGITDYDEMFTHYTDPYDNNTDDDYWTDAEEIAFEGTLNAWDPYDSDYVTKYYANGSYANGSYVAINNSVALPDLYDYNETLDNVYTSGQRDNLTSRVNYQIIPATFTTNDYGMIQTNYEFNITETVDQIEEILVFRDSYNSPGFDPDTAAGWSTKLYDREVQIQNTTGSHNFSQSTDSGQRRLYAESITTDLVDVLQNSDKTLRMRDYVRGNSSTDTNFSMLTNLFEVWVSRTPQPEIKDPTTEDPRLAVEETDIVPINFSWQYLQSNIEVINITFNSTLCPLSGIAEYIDSNTWQQDCTAPNLADGYYNVTIWMNHTTLGNISVTEENAIQYESVNAEVNYSSPLGNVQFLNCSPDWEWFPSIPSGQTSSIPAINATNNGTASGGFQIKLTSSPATGWTIYATNQSDYTQNFSLTTTYQTIWSSVPIEESRSIWLFANCSYVSSNPQTSIEMRAV